MSLQTHKTVWPLDPRSIRVEIPDQRAQDLGYVRPDWYLVFDAIHFPTPEKRPASQEQIAEQFGQSRDQVRYTIEQVNGKFVRFLREEVADFIPESRPWADIFLAVARLV